ncbi:hypothetical protein DSL72_005278 [Monilinia vaccinii-corymbosi]|uniref:2EXR domain-containing protein n=1 Tax=Monilinia vaccinii-corymbosi TaxID=61207 RepID=A0A8A3PER9_9HELO|nr:hypothetical protein DSL72_005278 [Monilinia vaccinii-corymbosi]
MTSFLELSTELQNNLHDTMKPTSESNGVVTRTRNQTIPANFAPSASSSKPLPSAAASASANNDRGIQPEILSSLLNCLGLEAVRKLLVSFLRINQRGLGHLSTTKGEGKIYETTFQGGSAIHSVNDGKFLLFGQLPVELKIKIFKYAFEAPRIVSVSHQRLKHNSSCHGHTRLVYSGPQNPYLYVNHLTRHIATLKLQNLFQTNVFHSLGKEFPTIKYNPAIETIWIREIDFWLLSNEYSCSLTLTSQNWAVRTLAITISSKQVIMDKRNLNRLSSILCKFFKGLQELIVIADELDFTTPGFRDEIVFVSRKSKRLPKRRVVAKYTPGVTSLSMELLMGLAYGEWKPEHWSALVSSLTGSLKSTLMKRKEPQRAIQLPVKTKISAEKIHSGLRDYKLRVEAWQYNGDEGQRKAMQEFSAWNVPTIKLLAAVTQNDLNRKTDS